MTESTRRSLVIFKMWLKWCRKFARSMGCLTSVMRQTNLTLHRRSGSGFKATHTYQYLCFHSHHPAAHERAVVRILMCRAEALSSSGVSRVQEEKLVSQPLQRKGYPKGFIHKHTYPQPDQRTPRDQVARGSVTLPYISGLSESIHRVLAPLAIQVTFRSCKTLRQELVHPKDPVPANRRKGVVYSIPCAECPCNYIGQTGWSLDHRFVNTTGL